MITIFKASNLTSQPAHLEKLFSYISRANLAVQMASSFYFYLSLCQNFSIYPMGNKLVNTFSRAPIKNSNSLIFTSCALTLGFVFTLALALVALSINNGLFKKFMKTYLADPVQLLTPVLVFSCVRSNKNLNYNISKLLFSSYISRIYI